MARNTKGAFRGTQTLVQQRRGHRRVQGKLKPRRASGTLVATLELVDPAHRRHDRLLPDEAELGRHPRARDHLRRCHLAGPAARRAARLGAQARQRRADHWFANCAAGGYIRSPDHFVNFPLKRTGGLGNPFSFDVDLDAGAKRNFAFTRSPAG